MSEQEISSLRQEILASEAARIDLLKYKLVAIAGLGGAALGFGEKPSGETHFAAEYLLCIIPFVCIYVDCLCWHNTLRILVIARFLANDREANYEKYLDDLQTKAKEAKDQKINQPRYLYEMEDWALQWSTWFLCLFVFFYGINTLHLHGDCNKVAPFLVAGTLSLIVSLFAKSEFNKRLDHLNAAADSIKQDTSTVESKT